MAPHALALGLWLLAAPARADDPVADDAPRGLSLTDPVACRSIAGYDDYDALDEASLTKDEKLMVYIRPMNYEFEREGERFTAHLVEDVNIRRKGQKKVFWARKGVLDYKAESEMPPDHIYLGTTISLKQLPVGEYTAEVVVRDKLRPADDKDAVASKTLTFRVVAKKAAAGSGSGADKDG
jgi:hypothetical protein